MILKDYLVPIGTMRLHYVWVMVWPPPPNIHNSFLYSPSGEFTCMQFSNSICQTSNFDAKNIYWAMPMSPRCPGTFPSTVPTEVVTEKQYTCTLFLCHRHHQGSNLEPPDMQSEKVMGNWLKLQPIVIIFIIDDR